MRLGVGIAVLLVGLGGAVGQAPVERRDATVDVAAEYVGRALFLRCFCAENTLSFDEQGKPVGVVKAEDWTLAAVNVTKVERKGPGTIEMEGVRVAVRFVPERREFERHPQADEKMRIALADTGDSKRLKLALEAMFAVGIDLPLQRAMPDYWRHYFDPRLDWPADELNGQQIYNSASDAAVTPPRIAHRAEPSYTAFAEHDRVKGTVQMRFFVNAEGAARRVAIQQPLGYGLDERAVEAMTKIRFTPAMRGGRAVATVVSMAQEFEVVAAPR